MNRKGMTIIEIVVAMAIFMVVVTLVIGAFVTVVRMKTLTSTMKESQQKTRIAVEMISRLSRQAERINLSGATTPKRILELYFNIDDAAKRSGIKFEIEQTGATSDYELYMTDCITFATDGSCASTGWNTIRTNLLGGTYTLNGASGFLLNPSTPIPPSLQIIFDGKIRGLSPTNMYYSDDFKVETEVLLEGLK